LFKRSIITIGSGGRIGMIIGLRIYDLICKGQL
jgi:hypothetical protein